MRAFLALATLFILVKVITWAAGYTLASEGLVKFDKLNYALNFYHLDVDSRYQDPTDVNFFSLWCYGDCEWYLSIARDGYPMRNQPASVRGEILKYAFFPLYPAIISLFSILLPVTAAAFTVTLLLHASATVAYVYLGNLLFPREKRNNLWALAFLLLFPFSIFYSLYFTESLFLLLSLLVFIFLKKERYGYMCLCGCLLCLSRPTGILIVLPVLYSLMSKRRGGNRMSAKDLRGYFAVALIPLGLLPYMALCYYKTGDWTFFWTIQGAWLHDNSSIIRNVTRNILANGLNFGILPLHDYHSSQVDYCVMVLFGAVLACMFFSRDFPRDLTLWGVVIWTVPLISKDLMSFSRYMIISFPVFYYLGYRLNEKLQLALIVGCMIGYGIVLKTIIQYKWVG